MNWLTYQVQRTLCLIAHLFRRPDLAKLEVVERELYKKRIQWGDEVVAHRNTYAKLCHALDRADTAEKALAEVLRRRIDAQVRNQHREYSEDMESARMALYEVKK